MSEIYEPTLPQALFGNATGEYDLGKEEGMVANELYALSEALGKRDPEAQAHGFLGGEWGYGQEFKNEVFEMFPYWWGDCTCGYEEAEVEWDEAHPHTPECWQTRWHAENERLYALKLPYDEKQRRMERWERGNGWDGKPGVAVYCDCGTGEKWAKWSAEHGHRPDCLEVKPNFRCGDVEVRWYKYIGRGMSVNRRVARAEWRDIFARCFASLEAA